MISLNHHESLRVPHEVSRAGPARAASRKLLDYPAKRSAPQAEPTCGLRRMACPEKSCYNERPPGERQVSRLNLPAFAHLRYRVTINGNAC
jgi:hypothetical protein